MYSKKHFVMDQNAIGNAIEGIINDQFRKAEISNQVQVYKIPSPNPDKYVIRIDIKVVKD